MIRARAYAKINLALVVGPLRPDGKHEVATVLQRIGVHDDVEVEGADDLVVEGFAQDTLVRDALSALARAAGVAPGWRVRIEKRIPVASGLGGGSSDAAMALRLAGSLLDPPVPWEVLHGLAAGVGADVPFFLYEGPRLGTGDGTDLTPVALPDDYAVLVVLPREPAKEATAGVYRDFDARDGASGFGGRYAALIRALDGIRDACDLASLPANDLATSPLVATLVRLGAFRADVSGAGPAVYGLFETPAEAEAAAEAVREAGRTWVTHPVAGP